VFDLRLIRTGRGGKGCEKGHHLVGGTTSSLTRTNQKGGNRGKVEAKAGSKKQKARSEKTVESGERAKGEVRERGEEKRVQGRGGGGL